MPLRGEATAWRGGLDNECLLAAERPSRGRSNSVLYRSASIPHTSRVQYILPVHICQFRYSHDRIAQANPKDVTLVLNARTPSFPPLSSCSLWLLRHTSFARLRLFNQASAEATNVFGTRACSPSNSTSSTRAPSTGPATRTGTPTRLVRSSGGLDAMRGAQVSKSIAASLPLYRDQGLFSPPFSSLPPPALCVFFSFTNDQWGTLITTVKL